MNIDANPPRGLITTRISGMNIASPSVRKNHITASTRLLMIFMDSFMYDLCCLISVTNPIIMLSNADLECNHGNQLV